MVVPRLRRTTRRGRGDRFHPPFIQAEHFGWNTDAVVRDHDVPPLQARGDRQHDTSALEVYLQALSRRLTNTWVRRIGSAMTSAAAGGSCIVSRCRRSTIAE